MKSRAVTLFRVGAWSWVVVGLVHLLAMTAGLLLAPPADRAMFERMAAHTSHIMGLTRSLYGFHLGFSLAMGCVLTCYGALNLLLVRHAPELVVRAPSVTWLNLGASLAGLGLALWTFPPPPILAFAVASVGFALCLRARR